MKREIFKYYLAYFIALIVIIAILGALLIYPAAHKITVIKQQIGQEKSDIQQKLSRSYNAKNIKASIDSMQSALTTLDKMFIQPGHELDLLSTLEAMAAKHHINLTIKPDFTGQNNTNTIVKIPLELNATGNFNDLMTFMNDLDAMDYYYVIDNLDLSKVDTNQSALKLTGQVYLKTP